MAITPVFVLLRSFLIAIIVIFVCFGSVQALKEFEKDDLKELGLPAGPRIAIYNAMHKTDA